MSFSNTNVRFDFGPLGVHRFELPETRTDASPVHFFGVKKGGSTLLAQVVRDLVPRSDLSLWEPPKEFFSRGLPMYQCVRDLDDALARPGLAIGTFRWLPENWLMNLHAGVPTRGLLLVRDPRDMLVSFYYSAIESHAVPGEHSEGPIRETMMRRRETLQADGTDVDTFALLKAPQFLRNYLRTLQLLTIDDLVLLRYEDIIYDKAELIVAVAERLRADMSDHEVKQLVEKHDVRPDLERPTEHIRQVHPGNHREKLAPETVRRLDETFGVVLDMLGYERAHEATLV